MAVPLFDTDTPLAPVRDEILERIGEVVRSGRFVLGPEVTAFEQEFAAYLGVAHVIGVANGTDALAIALRSLGVKPGDDVVVPSLTFYASAEAIADIGARPVFCDVDPDTRNVTVDTVRAALTPNTTAIMAVDLFGVPAPSAELKRELGLPVLEDAAQAAGATCDGRRAGALGDAATFSFYPSKNLPCFGDGGAIATDDDRVAELARQLRFHGSRDKETFDYVGYNSRLGRDPGDDSACAAAAFGRVGRWPSRGLRAHTWMRAWSSTSACHARSRGPIRPGISTSSPTRGPTRCCGRSTTPASRRAPTTAGSATISPSMAPYLRGTTPVLPVTEALGRDNIALPISPVFGADQAREVVAAIASAV